MPWRYSAKGTRSFVLKEQQWTRSRLAERDDVEAEKGDRERATRRVGRQRTSDDSAGAHARSAAADERAAGVSRVGKDTTKVSPPKPTLQKLGVKDDIEHFLKMFERTAKQREWIENFWVMHLVDLWTGKAMVAYANLSVGKRQRLSRSQASDLEVIPGECRDPLSAIPTGSQEDQ